MQEHLKKITIPAADGQRHEIAVVTPADIDARMTALSGPLDRLGEISGLLDVLLSEGPSGLAEHLVKTAASKPPGDYTGWLATAEHLSPGTLKKLLGRWGGVTPREIADHFPDVVAVVEPDNACLVEPAGAYRGGAVIFAKGGLVRSGDLGGTYGGVGGRHNLYPRNVDGVHYWNFNYAYGFTIAEQDHAALDKEAVPYAPPKWVWCDGFVNTREATSIRFIDRTGRSRLTQVYNYLDEGPDDADAMKEAFKDWPGKVWVNGQYEDHPHNEVRIRMVPSRINTRNLNVDSMFSGLTDVRDFPLIELTGCPGTYLFQRNPDRLPDASTKRKCKVKGIGSNANGQTEPQTDLSGLVNWDKDDLAYTINNCSHPAVRPWKILLSGNAYLSLTSAQRATLTSKGFTIVNAG